MEAPATFGFGAKAAQLPSKPPCFPPPQGQWREMTRTTMMQIDKKEQFGVKHEWQRKLYCLPYVCMPQEKGVAVLERRGWPGKCNLVKQALHYFCLVELRLLMRLACKLDRPRTMCACCVVCMFVSGQPMFFVCRYWFQTVGWRISSEKLKSGQFVLMSTIRRHKDVKSAV